ncbi:MAG: DUF1302 family protein [Candidatus Binatia bacterium]
MTWGRGALAAVVLVCRATAAPAFQLDGPAGRMSVDGFAEGLAVFRADRATQRQRPEGILGFKITDDLHRAVRLHLDVRTRFGGPPEHASGVGIDDLWNTFQDISPATDVEEAYADLHYRALDVRVGKQKFFWGRLDRFSPTDVLTPRRWTDPFLTDEKDAKVGIPALQASYFPPDLGTWATDLKAGLAWVPVPFPTRFPLPDERWFPPAASAAVDSINLPANLLPGLPPPELRMAVAAENRRPPQQLDEGGVGLRLTGLSGPVDWGLCYYDGPETTPTLDFAVTVDAPLAIRRLAHGGTPGVSDLAVLGVASRLTPRFGRIRLAGGDAAFRLGGFTVRAEAAYGMNREIPSSVPDLVNAAIAVATDEVHLTPNAAKLLAGRRIVLPVAPLYAERDVVNWGVGLDYLIDGWLPLLQVDQTALLGNDRPLLVNEVDTRLLFLLRKTFLGERLGTELVAVQELERGATSAVGKLTYEVTDHVRVQVGYLAIAGSRRTIIGQYHANDQGFARVRVSY